MLNIRQSFLFPWAADLAFEAWKDRYQESCSQRWDMQGGTHNTGRIAPLQFGIYIMGSSKTRMKHIAPSSSSKEKLS